MNSTIDENFDPNAYLDELIKAMNFQNEAPEKVALLKENLALGLHDAIFEAASEALEPEVIDQALEEFKEEKTLWDFMTKMLKISPAAQEAMTKAIDTFTDETLAAYEVMVKES